MTTELTFTERMLDEYGSGSPEYAAAVYEDMLDGAYERRAAIDENIAKIGEHLEREKRDIARQRAARARAAEWQQLDDKMRQPTEAELAAIEAGDSDAPLVLDDEGDWIPT